MNPQEKAAKTRADKAAARIWPDIFKSKQRTGCRCKLRKGMNAADLRPLKGGCTDVPGNPGGRFVCPTLDKYRRMLPNEQKEAA